MTEQETATATKVRVLTDATVEADFDIPQWQRTWRGNTPEAMAKLLEERVREFHDFIRDHRSQDAIQLTVRRIYEEQCSACGDQWKSYTEQGVESCSGCGAVISSSPQD